MDLKDNDEKLKDIGIKLGMIHPPESIIDEGIKELCSIPFRRKDGSVFACEGVVENWKGCPPHSPAVTETIEKLNSATGFLIMQFDNFDNTIYQKYIHQLTLDARKKLSLSGFNVIESYSCGPCQICAKGCNSYGDCRIPSLRLFALESCGFWVNHLCRKAGENSIYGDESWDIDWLTGWYYDSPEQEKYKSVSGILIK